MKVFIKIGSSIVSIFKYFFLGLFTIITIFPKYFIIGIKFIFIDKNNNKQKPNSKKNNLPIIMILLTLIVYFGCIFLISRWAVQKLKLEYLAKNIIENTKIVEKEENVTSVEQIDNGEPIDADTTYYPSDYWKYTGINYIDVDFTELLKTNPDTVGWLSVNNTKVNYPIVQATDNSYYLYHAFNKSENRNGWVFGDYRNNFTEFKDNSIIYAHNLTDRSMFGSLAWCLKPDWYKDPDNYNIKLSTPTSNTVWRIFSVYTIEVETYYLRTLFNDEEKHQDFINKMLKRSIYNFNTDVTTKDKLLTLSTCDDTGTKRLVIQAKMIKIDYK